MHVYTGKKNSNTVKNVTNDVQPSTRADNETTPPNKAMPPTCQLLENSVNYEDVRKPSWGSVSRMSVVNASCMSLASNTNTVVNGDYLSIDSERIDRHQYAVRTRPPPVPKKPSILRRFTNKEIKPTSREISKSHVPLKTLVRGNSPVQVEERSSYELLNCDTKDQQPVYTCPSEVAASMQNIAYYQ